LNLKDEEKFTDCNGNIIEIETRGERNYKQIYFKVKDVSIGFQLENLITTILHKNGGYEEKVDYTYYFVRTKLPN
jgi:hypothetical protein